MKGVLVFSTLGSQMVSPPCLSNGQRILVPKALFVGGNSEASTAHV